MKKIRTVIIEKLNPDDAHRHLKNLIEGKEFETTNEEHRFKALDKELINKAGGLDCFYFLIGYTIKEVKP